jgi:GT2 family glycosyltransferase
VPDVSVIIVNYKGWSRLGQCLNSLMVIPETQLTFEVIIVDNASNDGALEEFQTKYSHFRFFSNTGNNGFANGCNLGAKYAKGDYLLFLNPDTVIGEQAILGMLAKIRGSKPNSIVSCRQIREDGSKEKPYGEFLSPLTLTGWLRAITRIFAGRGERALGDEALISLDWVSGSVVMISKVSYLNIKGWDEDFWMYFEDVDLCKRARDAGGEVILLKDVTVEHNHGGSSRINARITTITKTEVDISRHVYISKHEKRVRCFYMQTFLVLNNLLAGFVPAVLGVLFFFIKRMSIPTMIYLSLIIYYINALLHGTWISPRSVRYRN